MNFTYEELREIHLALTEGRFLNQEVKDSAVRKVGAYIMLTKPNTDKADVEIAYTFACQERDKWGMKQIGLRDNPLKMREAEKAYSVWWQKANELEEQLTNLENALLRKNTPKEHP